MGDSSQAVQPPERVPRLDHLVYATPGVDAAIEDLARRLGVRAVAGGRHPAWGTRNALISLGPRRYLEIIGPDEARPAPPEGRPLGIDALAGSRLVTWAAASNEIEGDLAKAGEAGMELGAIQPGSRQRADGSALSWRATGLFAPRFGGVVPFLIDWADSPHPGASSPGGCSLLSLRAEHPEPNAVRSVFETLTLGIAVTPGPEPRLIARLATANGEVELA